MPPGRWEMDGTGSGSCPLAVCWNCAFCYKCSWLL